MEYLNVLERFGFPIFMCILLFIQYVGNVKLQFKISKEIAEKQSQAIEKLAESFQKVSESLDKLSRSCPVSPAEIKAAIREVLSNQ